MDQPTKFSRKAIADLPAVHVYNGNFENALIRFRRACQTAAIIKGLRDRRENPARGDRRRAKRRRAESRRRRAERRQR